MPNNQNIPKVRAKGSPYADNYGATDSDGNPVANVVRKQQAHRPTPIPVSPNEKAGATRPTLEESTRAQSLARLTLLHSTPAEVARVAKALSFYSSVTKTRRTPAVPCYDRRHKLVGFTTRRAFRRVRKAKGDPQIACFDQNGTLLGLVDPDDMNAVVSATPGQSAAGSTDTDRGTGLTVGDPAAQPVAKAQARRIFRWDPAGRQRVAKQRTTPPVRIIAHGGRRGR
jgi:hypothetical protein